MVRGWTYGFFDLAKLLKLLAQGGVVGMPCKASGWGQWQSGNGRKRTQVEGDDGRRRWYGLTQ